MVERKQNSTVVAVVIAVVVVGFLGAYLFKSPSSTESRTLQATAGPVGFAAKDTSGKSSGNFQVNGPHYNLNIIGTNNVGDVGDSMGHTLFVPLNGRTKIMMTQAPDGQFVVTDRNGLDGSASFNLAPGTYNIYAWAGGKPGGFTDIESWGEFTDAQDGTKIQLLGYVNIQRTKGTPKAVNINELFYVDVTLCLEIDTETGTCTKQVVYTDYWVFNIEELLNYWWEYTNSGLKLLRVRFYPCTLDPSATAVDYCRWGDGTAINSQKTIVDI